MSYMYDYSNHYFGMQWRIQRGAESAAAPPFFCRFFLFLFFVVVVVADFCYFRAFFQEYFWEFGFPPPPPFHRSWIRHWHAIDLNSVGFSLERQQSFLNVTKCIQT